MSWLAIVFLVIMCGVLPVLSIRAARQMKAQQAKPTIPELFINTLIMQGTLSALAIGAANTSGIALFPRPTFTLAGALAGAIFLALALVANVWRWRVLDPAEREELSWLRPRGGRDVGAWAGVALTAGTCEEIIYRGALYGLVLQATANEWATIALCVVVFALGHWVQGRGAMLIVVLFAVGFHALVRITGDLYTAMIVHAVYDFAAGLVLLKLASRTMQAAPNTRQDEAGITPDADRHSADSSPA